MKLELKPFKTYGNEELITFGKFDEDMIFVYSQLTKGYSKAEILMFPTMTETVVSRSLKNIRAIFDYPKQEQRLKFEQIFRINSGQLLSEHISNEGLHDQFNHTKTNFLLNFTLAQKAVAKLYLNGYCKAEIAKIFGVKNDSSIENHLKVLKDSVGSEVSDKESKWFLETKFSFQSLVYLVFLHHYAKNSLDTNYRGDIIESNITELVSQNPIVFRPIISNQEMHDKLKHLRA